MHDIDSLSRGSEAAARCRRAGPGALIDVQIALTPEVWMLQDDARRMELVLDSLLVRNCDEIAAALVSMAEMRTNGLVVREAAETGRQPEHGHGDRTENSVADPASYRPCP